LDADGKAKAAITINYPDDYTHEGTEEVLANLERAQFVDGQWIIHDRLQLVGPSTASVCEQVEIVATFPAGSPDSEARIDVAHIEPNGTLTEADPITVPIADGTASQTLEFAEPGTYRITVSSRFHGAQTLGVTVVEPEASE
jgi:hypothetical protein